MIDAPPDSDAAGGFDPLRLDLQLCFALYSAANLVTRLYRPLLEPLGLTYPQYLVMMALWERAPRTVSDLGEALGLDSGTLTPLLKRLEASGVVARARDAQDERRVQVSLTDQGRALRERALAVPGEIVCRLGMPLEDLYRLRLGLQDLVKGMSEAD